MPAHRLAQVDTGKMLRRHYGTMTGTERQRTIGRPKQCVRVGTRAKNVLTLESRFLNRFLNSDSSGAVIRLLFKF